MAMINPVDIGTSLPFGVALTPSLPSGRAKP
jgi:hypothetical protein